MSNLSDLRRNRAAKLLADQNASVIIMDVSDYGSDFNGTLNFSNIAAIKLNAAFSQVSGWINLVGNGSRPVVVEGLRGPGNMGTNTVRMKDMKLVWSDISENGIGDMGFEAVLDLSGNNLSGIGFSTPLTGSNLNIDFSNNSLTDDDITAIAAWVAGMSSSTINLSGNPGRPKAQAAMVFGNLELNFSCTVTRPNEYDIQVTGGLYEGLYTWNGGNYGYDGKAIFSNGETGNWELRTDLDELLLTGPSGGEDPVDGAVWTLGPAGSGDVPTLSYI